MSKKHIIWSNMESDCGDPECPTRHQGYCDCARIFLEDTMYDLNKILDGQIIAIARIGTWQGTRQGYRLLNNNLNSIFSVMEDMNEFYSDGKNVLSRQIHHDGTNHIIFRELRTDRDNERFMNEIYNGVELTPQKLAANTRSLHPHVAKVYGW